MTSYACNKYEQITPSYLLSVNWKISVCFYILELKCIKKDTYRSEISNLLTSIYIQVILSNYVGP